MDEIDRLVYNILDLDLPREGALKPGREVHQLTYSDLNRVTSDPILGRRAPTYDGHHRYRLCIRLPYQLISYLRKIDGVVEKTIREVISYYTREAIEDLPDELVIDCYMDPTQDAVLVVASVDEPTLGFTRQEERGEPFRIINPERHELEEISMNIEGVSHVPRFQTGRIR